MIQIHNIIQSDLKEQQLWRVCVCVCLTFLPPREQVSGGGVLVMFRGLEPQLEGEEPRILTETHMVIPSSCTHQL